ncbi:hypothetical protein HBI32_203070 [Parastagonospora nodorum]|nr:hypothetical protein HBI32_203070 [Parastagonospora nodorum]
MSGHPMSRSAGSLHMNDMLVHPGLCDIRIYQEGKHKIQRRQYAVFRALDRSLPSSLADNLYPLQSIANETQGSGTMPLYLVLIIGNRHNSL